MYLWVKSRILDKLLDIKFIIKLKEKGKTFSVRSLQILVIWKLLEYFELKQGTNNRAFELNFSSYYTIV